MHEYSTRIKSIYERVTALTIKVERGLGNSWCAEEATYNYIVRN